MKIELKLDERGLFLVGSFISDSLFKGEMIVKVESDGVPDGYVEKCIDHYNSLSENVQMQDRIQSALAKFFLYMYGEWSDMGIYDDIVRDLEAVMDGYNSGEKLIGYLSRPAMYIDPPEDDRAGYVIQCECPWEPEHMCALIFRGDELLYAGPSEGLNAWEDDDDYVCIWNEEEQE